MCSNCGEPKTPLVRWCGLIWYGVPWPLRLRVTWPAIVYVVDKPGCGCIAVLKDFRVSARVAWRVNMAKRAKRLHQFQRQEKVRAYWLARRKAESCRA